MTTAMARMTRDEVTRGTTSAVKTLNAVPTMTRMPRTSAARRRAVSTPSSCHAAPRGHRGEARSPRGRMARIDGAVPTRVDRYRGTHGGAGTRGGRRGGVAALVAPTPRAIARSLARPGQEGHGPSDGALLRPGTRRSDLFWMDRWSDRTQGLDNLPATVHPAEGSESMVPEEHRHRREVDRYRPDAHGGRSRDSQGQGRRPLGRRLCQPIKHRGPG